MPSSSGSVLRTSSGWLGYRNGVQVAAQASTTGALAVANADWAVGSTGNGWADAFAGLVDEVAIYNYALSANQVAGHYRAGTLAPRLTIVPAGGGNVTITWPYGTLLQSDNVTGPWTAVPGNPISPHTTSAGGGGKYYRF
jgi:Concanavalin A-like lectin/glucanases superfamily